MKKNKLNKINWKKVWNKVNHTCYNFSCRFGTCIHEKRTIRKEIEKQLEARK